MPVSMSETKEYITESEAETMDLAERFAAGLNAGDVVCLQGDLGAGKTYFVKGIAREMGIDPDKVHSPTYTLINEYYGRLPLYHFDWYRIDTEGQALEIGAEEYFYGDGVSVIEWPEKIQGLIPEQAVWIKIELLNSSKRKFMVDLKKK